MPFAVTHFQVLCDQWIHGAIFYGPAKGAETATVRAEADEMLSTLTQQIVHGLKGKRFILGDFNQLHGTQTRLDRNPGFADACHGPAAPQHLQTKKTEKTLFGSAQNSGLFGCQPL